MRIAVAAPVLAIVFAAGAAGFVYSGLYDISATDQHLALTYHAIRKTMERAVERRAKDIRVPPLDAPAQIERGVTLYRAHCVPPLATPLQRSGLERTPAQLYWVVKNGIKMTAMPAWEFRMSEEDLWALVAFLKRLPYYSVPQYHALKSAPHEHGGHSHADGAPDVERGKRALKEYGCVGCHEIPGQVGPEARLGPTLKGIGSRSILGGVLPNTPDSMARWLRDPRAFATNTAMPDLGVTERDARDMAAYLATLK